MDPPRAFAVLAPRPPASAPGNSDYSIGSVTSASSSAKQQRHRHTDAEWEEKSDDIARLYIEANKTAKEIVIELGQQGFVVSRRTLMKKIAEWGLAKNFRKDDLLTLLAKRDSRMTNKNSKTVFFKDGQELTEDRLLRFSQRGFVKAMPMASPSKKTPEGVEYKTPESPASVRSVGDLDTDRNIVRKLTTIEPVTFMQGFITMDFGHKTSIPHTHQMGIFGISYNCNYFDGQFRDHVISRAHEFARNLIKFARSSADGIEEPGYSQAKARRLRCVKVAFSRTGNTNTIVSSTSLNRIIFQVKHSDFCHQLMGLNGPDRLSWKAGWTSMGAEEEERTKKLAMNTFGDPEVQCPRTSFLNIFMLLSTEKGEKNTIFARLSIGLGDEVPLECPICERDVVMFDCIRASGAVQLNVPLPKGEIQHYDPSEFMHGVETNIERWVDQNTRLKGWAALNMPKRVPEVSHPDDMIVDPDEPFEVGLWDPNSTLEPAVTFQPYAQCEPGMRYKRECPFLVEEKFEPFPEIEESWNPDGCANRRIKVEDFNSDEE